jgi:hypothetical protein
VQLAGYKNLTRHRAAAKNLAGEYRRPSSNSTIGFDAVFQERWIGNICVIRGLRTEHFILHSRVGGSAMRLTAAPKG